MPLLAIAFRISCFKPLPRQLVYVQSSRAHSSRSRENEDDLNEARRWFSAFDRHTIPYSIASTTYSRASGAGGQKTNKTSSKATTSWPFSALQTHVPKVLHLKLQESRYAVNSSSEIQIHSDAHRSQSQNREDTHRKFYDEIKKIYDQSVPGITSPEVVAKLAQLKVAGNSFRLQAKKQQSDKKKARSKGGGRGAD